jgi:hypothetical protein
MWPLCCRQHAQPSAAQWKMIFSDTPSTSVVAGAGAGKSTSLVLRILLLTHYLGFELSSMTVVTFTRESRKDFHRKLHGDSSLCGADTLSFERSPGGGAHLPLADFADGAQPAGL